MPAAERAVVIPTAKVVVQLAAWQQILANCSPLTPSAEDVHQTIDDLPHVDRAFVASSLSRRDQRSSKRPFVVGQIARLAKLAAVIAAAVVNGPHCRSPANRSMSSESQPTL
jgi:hypothetical protein